MRNPLFLTSVKESIDENFTQRTTKICIDYNDIIFMEESNDKTEIMLTCPERHVIVKETIHEIFVQLHGGSSGRIRHIID